ncbi:PG0541 family transporter-associated protein [Desulfonatronospira sp.]|uniref:PG0541 family transporter-associated protein n=1 Tax=Desulfonatronospira sp. TaxID=1962951 RepID=UPI0025C586D9|nr:PG0541 family transporter-associated protein [Desulfonatronospira sp.]
MKLVHISFRFEYVDHVERILDDAGIEDYVRYPMVEGKDQEGKHFGSQVYPGSVTVCQALVKDDIVMGLMESLQRFRMKKGSHRHLRAVVISVEQALGTEEET